jgi:hypothetical protein
VSWCEKEAQAEESATAANSPASYLHIIVVAVSLADRDFANDFAIRCPPGPAYLRGARPGK